MHRRAKNSGGVKIWQISNNKAWVSKTLVNVMYLKYFVAKNFYESVFPPFFVVIKVSN